MTQNQILAITFWSLACLVCPSGSANAGWFGPSNYEECVLEKMKGQAPYMLKTAQDACRTKFTEESKEVPLDKRLIQFNWCMNEQTMKQICVVAQPNNYKITKVKLEFSVKNPCTKVSYPDIGLNIDQFSWEVRQYYENLNNWITLTGEKSYFSATYTFKLPPRDYYCADVFFPDL